ncbi:MAG: hypothetical protein P8Y16_05785, partial [Sulfurimonas sp.]
IYGDFIYTHEYNGIIQMQLNTDKELSLILPNSIRTSTNTIFKATAIKCSKLDGNTSFSD